MIPDEYISLLNPHYLPKKMWAPKIDEILEFLERFELNPRQNQILEYLLQLYAIVRDDPNASFTNNESAADAVVSYVKLHPGHESMLEFETGCQNCKSAKKLREKTTD